MAEQVFTNARIVTPDAVVEGAVQIKGGVITDLSSSPSQAPGAIDCEGDYLLPGLVELHTDNLERHLTPRPGVDWPRRAALAAHDGEFVSVGVSTIVDALRVGTMRQEGLGNYAPAVAEAMHVLQNLDLLRADHYLHLRCEICSPKLVEEFDSVARPQNRDQDETAPTEPLLRLISLMDHTPGQRQFANVDKLRQYYQGKNGWSDERMEAFIIEAKALQEEWAEPNLAAMKARSDAGAYAVASHDDATESHVADSLRAGATIAEFPTTLEAARASQNSGLKVLMGAPNILRGLSHSGNVSAMELAQEGLVDILSSDYAPAALMLGAFKLAEETDYGLPKAIATVTETPAAAIGLKDRGAIRTGLRADLARVYRAERLCVTRAVWREGRRVM
ncbi:MAG: alpha-D-ribose 1-methylphosphonate 5-triphosphate diphosphatase [Rhodobacteraceae bacterium]|nr:alpha-D-ribose 1-methylphosphonate 5-triphosphate diphosphatase [Paracoccaceae bacterium]